MNQAVEQEEVKEYVIFAAQVISMASDQGFSASDVFNGLSVATAAMLVDYVSNEDGSVDATSLQYAINNFKNGLDKAAEFAVKQLAEQIAAQNS
jgi:hypothetical protein